MKSCKNMWTVRYLPIHKTRMTDRFAFASDEAKYKQLYSSKKYLQKGQKVGKVRKKKVKEAPKFEKFHLFEL